MIGKDYEGARCGERHPDRPHVSCHRMVGHGRKVTEWAERSTLHAGYDAVDQLIRRWSDDRTERS